MASAAEGFPGVGEVAMNIAGTSPAGASRG